MKMLTGVVLAVVCLTECEPQTTAKKQTQPDSFKVDIPLTKDGQPFGAFLVKEKVEKLMGLANLTSGTKDTFIRFWLGYAQSNFAKLVELNKNTNGWNGKYYTILLFSEGQKLDSVSSNAMEVIPKVSWNNFISALTSLDILTLPDDSDLRNYPRGADGSTVIIEVATKSMYRFYTYWQPNFASHHNPEAGQVKKMTELLEKELEINFHAESPD
jgi:hypothetical protein